MYSMYYHQEFMYLSSGKGLLYLNRSVEEKRLNNVKRGVGIDTIYSLE